MDGFCSINLRKPTSTGIKKIGLNIDQSVGVMPTAAASRVSLLTPPQLSKSHLSFSSKVKFLIQCYQNTLARICTELYRIILPLTLGARGFFFEAAICERRRRDRG